MSSSSKKSKNKPKVNFRLGIGIGLIILSVFVLYRLFHDPLRHELNYAISSISPASPILTPPNTDFAIVIGKIGAAAAVVRGVDPYNSRIYQVALRDGVAHAKGSGLPGQGSNIFLFAHSSADLLTAERYNSVFYLMHHLEAGDLIKLWYQGLQYDYQVTDKKLVAPGDLQYLTKQVSAEQLTLMTCWPPGTSLERLIVIAKPL